MQLLLYMVQETVAFVAHLMETRIHKGICFWKCLIVNVYQSEKNNKRWPKLILYKYDLTSNMVAWACRVAIKTESLKPLHPFRIRSGMNFLNDNTQAIHGNKLSIFIYLTRAQIVHLEFQTPESLMHLKTTLMKNGIHIVQSVTLQEWFCMASWFRPLTQGPFWHSSQKLIKVESRTRTCVSLLQKPISGRAKTNRNPTASIF